MLKKKIINKIIKLHKKGKSIRWIAKMLKISPTTVCGHINKWKLNQVKGELKEENEEIEYAKVVFPTAMLNSLDALSKAEGIPRSEIVENLLTRSLIELGYLKEKKWKEETKKKIELLFNNEWHDLVPDEENIKKGESPKIMSAIVHFNKWTAKTLFSRGYWYGILHGLEEACNIVIKEGKREKRLGGEKLKITKMELLNYALVIDRKGKLSHITLTIYSSIKHKKGYESVRGQLIIHDDKVKEIVKHCTKIL